MNTSIKKFGKYSYTPDRIFAIENDIGGDSIGSEYLFINPSYNIEANTALWYLINKKLIEKNGVSNIGTRTSPLLYDTYRFYRQLRDERKRDKKRRFIDDDEKLNENDCMKFGECLSLTVNTNDTSIFDNTIQKNSTPPVFRAKGTLLSFGEDHETNEKILGIIPNDKKDNNAIPVNGETYAIVRQGYYIGAPYHIAFVLYSHENINITIEASADSGEVYFPRFGFYDTIPQNKNTFHNFWKVYYENSHTIVLEKRDINVVLQEIENENIEESKRSSKRKKTMWGGACNRKKKTIKMKKCIRIKTKKNSKRVIH